MSKFVILKKEKNLNDFLCSFDFLLSSSIQPTMTQCHLKPNEEIYLVWSSSVFYHNKIVFEVPRLIFTDSETRDHALSDKGGCQMGPFGQNFLFNPKKSCFWATIFNTKY